MSKHWIVILLFISLAFNMAVAGSFIYLKTREDSSRRHHHRRESRERRDRDDRRRDERLFVDSEKTRELRDQFHSTKQDLLAELAKDPINEAKLNSIIDSSLVVQTKLEHELGTSLISLRKTMTAEEANEYFTRRLEKIKNQRRNRYEHYRNNRR